MQQNPPHPSDALTSSHGNTCVLQHSAMDPWPWRRTQQPACCSDGNLVRGAMGSLDEEVEGSSSPGQSASLWLWRSSPCKAGGDMGQAITFESPLWKEGEQQDEAPCVRHSSAQ